MAQKTRKNMTPEEIYQRRMRLRAKFKACIRLIMANVGWLQELEDDELGDDFKKNIAVLTRKKAQNNIMTLAEKAILNQPPDMRSDEDKINLRNIFTKIKCFKYYPSEVIDELPSIAYFSNFTPNRFVIKQGYEPLYMYVILSGQVVATYTYYSNLRKEMVSKDLMIMGAGSIFGELAMLYNTTRCATVKTLSNSEFIWFRKDDFHRVLQPVIAKFYFDIEMNLSLFDYFREWSQAYIREACILCKKKYYRTAEIILAENIGHNDFVYFVIKGRCNLLEHLLVREVVHKGHKREILIEEDSHHFKAKLTKDALRQTIYVPENEENRKHSIRPSVAILLKPSLIPTSLGLAQPKFMRVCTFHRMACFNVGESLKNRLIVADEECELLLLPKFFLDEKSMLTFKIVQQYLSRNIPSTKEIFRQYIEERKWTQYKHKMTKRLREGLKKSNSNCIANVPYTIRLGEDLGEL